MDDSSPSQRSRALKQFSLLLLGASFTASSILISRRSVLRRTLLSQPLFYTPNPLRPFSPAKQSSPAAPLRASTSAVPSVNPASAIPTSNAAAHGEGAVLGLHALGLATLNVTSFAVLLIGGLAWAFDLSSLEELRERTQRALRGGRAGQRYVVDPEDEEEFERVVDDLLRRFGLEGLKKEGLEKEESGT